MAKKRIEPFNPWPSFVDLFASVIMVILMFMLILIVNITYYAQFKYKISYTGTVAINQIITKPVVTIDINTKEKEPLIEKKKQEAIAGIDFNSIKHDLARQDNILYEDWMVIKYLDNEIILDPKSIKDIDKFLLGIKKKFPKHSISIYIKEPQNQISASIGKQIALSRVLNIRNVLRNREYRNEDV
ncbi:MAG: hypothetical protein RBR59_08135, partial [Sulfurimonadaceae bacterium]|nr:hypothetical protein [Sulfurimonadaceae bacterium]